MTLRGTLVAIALGLVALGCAPRRLVPSVASHGGSASDARSEGLEGPRVEASAGVRDPALARVLQAHWLGQLEADPEFATEVGVHVYDDRWTATGAASLAQRRRFRDDVLVQARAIDALRLETSDARTLRLFTDALAAEARVDVCRFETWSLGARFNPVARFFATLDVMPRRTEVDAKRLLARVRAIPAEIEDELAQLRLGRDSGFVSSREAMRRGLAMVEGVLARTTSSWPIVTGVGAAFDELGPRARRRLAVQILRALDERVRPALERYVRAVRADLVPRARADDAPGLVGIPSGSDCYAALIERYTTTRLTASAIHQIGHEQIARTDAALESLGQKVFGTGARAEVLARLREDLRLRFRSEVEIEEAAALALADAMGRVSGFFGRLPTTPCVVRRIPAHEAPFATIAYYRPPLPGGRKPGEYFVNVHEPRTRAAYQARALAFHEAVPGHHLQIALAQENRAVPAFRRHGGYTVFVEGWALYAEQIADEMGLYRNDLEQLGRVSFDAWRSARLVVDTGLHAFGWSRDRAKAFLREHTALDETNLDNEVDRYITWPGQALAYKLGHLAIAGHRKRAEQELGARFDLRAFHDAILAEGAVSLPVLEAIVDAYVERSRVASP